MTDASFSAGLIWLVVFIYALGGSVDFGGTFWRMVFRLRGDQEAAAVAERYVHPLWETTNIFLVLIAVGLIGFFPQAAWAFGSVLVIPASLILILLALRGAAIGYGYVMHGRLGEVVSGVTAVLLPATLVLVLPVSAGGFARLRGGVPVLDLGALLTSPTTYGYLVFGLASGLFISATFLADYAHTAGQESVYATFRRQALRAGPVAIVVGALSVFVLPTLPWLHGRLLAAWPWFFLSLLAFAGAWLAFGRERPRWAVVLTAVQFGLAQIGYGLAHAPYLLYPFAPTAASFTPHAMFVSALAVVLIGLILLVPGFVWLWRLFVIDPRYTHG